MNADFGWGGATQKYRRWRKQPLIVTGLRSAGHFMYGDVSPTVSNASMIGLETLEVVLVWDD